MKPIRILLSIIAALSLFGCTKSVIPVQEGEVKETYPSDLSSKSLVNIVFQVSDCEDTFVTEDDIAHYLQYKSLVLNADLTESEIAPILDYQGDTMMYAINYPNGWEVIAADKRCPVVLASDATGYFVFEEQIPPKQAWLRNQGEQVMRVRGIKSYEDISDQDIVAKMQNSHRFWKMIAADTGDVLVKPDQTKSGPGTLLPSELEIYDIVIDTLINIHIDHLVQTHWDQNPPYNSYCPFKSNSTTQRAKAGCVAVAVGQVANYFNELCGYPEDAPLTAFCDAQIPAGGNYQASVGDPHMYVSNLSSSAWNSIPSDGDMCAKLLAEIGIAVDMQYDDTESGSWELGESYFDDKCFDFVSGAYIKSSLISNITSGKPVIVAASNSVPPPYDGATRHAFIIDGYHHVKIRHTIYYRSDPDEPDPGTPIGIDIPYSEWYEETENITINWGWGAYSDTSWYPIDSAWQEYTEDKQMLYNLTPQI